MLAIDNYLTLAVFAISLDCSRVISLEDYAAMTRLRPASFAR